MAETSTAQREYQKKWYAENRERERAKRRAYREAHKDEAKAQWARRYAANSETILAKAREARAKDPERMRSYTRAYYGTIRGRAIALLRGARQRAARKGVTYDLSLDWLTPKLEAGICEATGRTLEISERAAGPWAPSLDRRRAGEGYTKENTQVVIWAYNLAKGPWSDEEFAELSRLLAAGGLAG